MPVDRENNEIDLMTWARLKDNPEYRYVRVTELPDNVTISTQWIGESEEMIGCACGNHQPFGTAKRSASGAWTELQTYPDEASAIAGHERWVHQLGQPE